MSFFPAGFDPRDPHIRLFDLAEIDTPDGPARFMMGADGIFTDINGNQWVGSQLITAGSVEAALGGIAAEGSLTFSFFQDPLAPDLIAEIKAQGADYVAGRTVRFFIQPISSAEQMYAPAVPPIQWMRRTMRTLTFSAEGAQGRSITVTFEAWTEQRKGSRRIILNTQGHSQLIGEENPSLQFIPTTNFQEEKLFG